MEIRPTSRADIPAVDALLARSYPALLKSDYPASILVTALPLISRAQPELVTCGTYFGCYDGDAIVSAGGWTRSRPGRGGLQKDVGHIRHVVSDPRYVRRGFGRALMTHVLEDARQARVRRVLCQSTRTAEPFYAACGFMRQREIEVPLQPGISFPAVLMEILL